MFGMPGQHKNFGMGVILDAKNNMHGSIQTAIKDFEKLHGAATSIDKKMIASQVHWNKSMDLMASATKDFIKAGALAGSVAWIASLGKDTEQTMADLKSLGVGMNDLTQIQQDMRRILITERMPVPKKEAMDALKDLKSAEIAVQDLTSAFKTSGTVAIAAMGTVPQALDAYTKSYLLYFNNMEGTIEQKNQRFADTFVSAVNVYKTWLPELSAQFGDVATQASMMGMKFEETVAAVGTLVHAGLGAEAGTSLSRALLKIGNAEEELGLKFTNSRGKMLSLLQIVDKLRKKFGRDLSINEMEQLTKAFDVYGAKSIRALMSLRDSFAKGIESTQEMGIAQKTAEIRTDTLSYKFISLKNSVTELGEAFSATTGMRDTVDSMTDLINATSQFVRDNPTLVKSLYKIAEAVIAIYAVKGGVKAGRSLWGIGASTVAGAATIYGKIKTGTYNPFRWFSPSVAKGAVEVGAKGVGSQVIGEGVESTMARMFGKNIMSAQKLSYLARGTNLLKGILPATPIGAIPLAAMIAKYLYPTGDDGMSPTQGARHKKYFEEAAEYVPVVQAPYSDQRKLEVNVTINGQKVDAELLSDSQIDRITQKFSDAFFVNPLRMGTQGAPPQ